MFFSLREIRKLVLSLISLKYRETVKAVESSFKYNLRKKLGIFLLINLQDVSNKRRRRKRIYFQHRKRIPKDKGAL